MNEELTIIENRNLNNNFQKIQENFLNSNLGKVVNNAIDIGLKSILPDLIEDEVINIKDKILENGLEEGIKEAISVAIDFGKSAIGIVTGNFENMNQVDMAIRKGGIIDSISDVLDFAVRRAKEKGKIDNTTANLIKKGKNTILDTVSDKIESIIETQVKSVEKLEDYCNNWNEFYKEQNFEKMETAYKNIEKYLNKTIPLESTIVQARKIENLHNLIKNNGKQFNISEEEKKLAETLIK